MSFKSSFSFFTQRSLLFEFKFQGVPLAEKAPAGITVFVQPSWRSWAKQMVLKAHVGKADLQSNCGF